MSYYMGDYRGDFYAPYGDPGIGSFLGRVLKGAGGLVPGVGGLISKLGGIVNRSKGRIGPMVGSVGEQIVKHPVITAAGGAGALAGAETLMRLHNSHAGAGMRGMHMSKGKHPHMVRNRRMNFANPRALRRATRRLHSFARHYRRVIGFVSPRKPKGRMYFKKAHRKAA